ncbi:RlpA-like double-psi beta-barrel-protein domain-containing protein-containing protein [Leucosporidium creatinivorum]|uniref:RlpA-like double-psi beta-barrel-protein domain-containing protein-containing protein n=1 Tax=Leucosporidium creatinivorum TaxID=106004 RepID=A0A1Y2FXJ5_9BASI|nr:RlpA-like double-psi beta-barrel-protein domain-containing protein-containing protein [Leucosporidium creatinivorum]
MRFFTLLPLLSFFLSSSLRAGASPSSSDLNTPSNFNSKRASAHLSRRHGDGSLSSPHTGLSAFSRRATAKISTYSGPLKGQATWYGNDGSGGACSLPGRSSDLKFAAFSGAKWDNSANCGACVRVTGPNGVIDVQIIDECPECAAGSLDLSTSAFSKIAPISRGVVPITWEFISCVSAGLEKGSVSVVWKSGSSAYWMAIQVRGAAFPVQSIAIRAATSATYTNLKREDYNYFSATSGMGNGPFVVLVRYQNGSKTIIKNVKLNSIVEDD